MLFQLFILALYRIQLHNYVQIYDQKPSWYLAHSLWHWPKLSVIVKLKHIVLSDMKKVIFTFKYPFN